MVARAELTTRARPALTLKDLGFEAGETVLAGAKRLGLPDQLVKLAMQRHHRRALDQADLTRPVDGNEQSRAGFSGAGLLLQRELLSQLAETAIVDFTKTAKPPPVDFRYYEDAKAFTAFCEEVGVLAGQTSNEVTRVELALLIRTKSRLHSYDEGSAMVAAINVLEGIALSVSGATERLHVIGRIPLTADSPIYREDAQCAHACIAALGRIAAKSSPAVIDVIATKLEAVAKRTPSSCDHERLIASAAAVLKGLGREVAIYKREGMHAGFQSLQSQLSLESRPYDFSDESRPYDFSDR